MPSKKETSILTLILRNKSYWKRALTTRTNTGKISQMEFQNHRKMEKHNFIFVETWYREHLNS